MIAQAVALVAAMLLAGCATPPPQASPLTATSIVPVWQEVAEADGPAGRWCRPATASDRSPVAGLVFIGGSEGGLSFAEAGAERACRRGFAALALGYWRYPDRPAALEIIPLEFFDRSIGWFADRPGVDGGKVGLVGYSRGAEGALLVASRSRRLAAVAAIVPSSYAGASINFADFFRLRSAWAEDGQPLPFVSNRPDRPGADWSEVMASQPPASVEGQRADYRALKATSAFAAAAIPVERIAGPVLLMAAERDTVWASADMARDLEDRLRRLRPGGVVERVEVEGAAHDFMAPATDGQASDPAAEDAWARLFAFFGRAMRSPA